jgi:hypothetical protein
MDATQGSIQRKPRTSERDGIPPPSKRDNSLIPCHLRLNLVSLRGCQGVRGTGGSKGFSFKTDAPFSKKRKRTCKKYRLELYFSPKINFYLF